MKFLIRMMSLVACFWILVACVPQPSALNDLKQWDLVWISDSSGYGVAELLAEAIEQERGVKVNVVDLSIGSLSAARVLNALRGGDEPHAVLSRLPQLISQAEVIVFFANPLLDGKHVVLKCMEPDPDFSEPCSTVIYARYRADLEAIYKEIFRLRAGAPTIVRAYEIWLRPAWWKTRAALSACSQCVGLMNTVIAEVAAQNHVPLARVADAFNGSNHGEDPTTKGYIGADGEHASPAGMKVIADLLRGLGYEPVKP